MNVTSNIISVSGGCAWSGSSHKRKMNKSLNQYTGKPPHDSRNQIYMFACLLINGLTDCLVSLFVYLRVCLVSRLFVYVLACVRVCCLGIACVVVFRPPQEGADITW